MSGYMPRLFYWSPRILALLFAGFISLFALDAFTLSNGLGENLFALFMHLIPTVLVLAILTLAWRWERIGGALFILLGVLYLTTTYEPLHWSAFLTISIPLWIIGGLFLVCWWCQTYLKPAE